jgi:predicted transcriptional regulator of viral defense system
VLGQRVEGETVSPERAKILATLARVGKPMTIQQIADDIGGKPKNVKYLLFKLHHEGQIERVATGLYRIPPPQEELPY